MLGRNSKCKVKTLIIYKKTTRHLLEKDCLSLLPNVRIDLKHDEVVVYFDYF